MSKRKKKLKDPTMGNAIEMCIRMEKIDAMRDGRRQRAASMGSKAETNKRAARGRVDPNEDHGPKPGVWEAE